jgi:alanine-glyoxylate transaminase/serine-glyoxylate transaminase/serine-pyruvate transaminase
MEAYQSRSTPVGSYYADWSKWLPVMEAYEERRPSYFGTPPVNLIWALHVSLGQILDEGVDARFRRHRRVSEAVKAGVTALGMGQVPVSDDVAATTLTAPRYPEGVSAGDLLGRVKEEGVILAGGLHPQIKSEYFRIGHMGEASLSEVVQVIGALETALHDCGYSFEPGIGLSTAVRSWVRR